MDGSFFQQLVIRVIASVAGAATRVFFAKKVGIGGAPLGHEDSISWFNIIARLMVVVGIIFVWTHAPMKGLHDPLMSVGVSILVLGIVMLAEKKLFTWIVYGGGVKILVILSVLSVFVALSH